MRTLSAWDPSRTPWCDPGTGRLTREAQVWLRDLWQRTGGAVADSSSDVLDAAMLLRHTPASMTIRAADGATVTRTVDGWQVGVDLLALLPFLPREKPQRDVADSQAVLAGQVFGY